MYFRPEMVLSMLNINQNIVEPEGREEGVGADETQGRQALGPGGRPSKPK